VSIRSFDFLTLAIDIPPKDFPRGEGLMLVQNLRAGTFIWEAAFGDVSIADVESVPRQFYK